VASKVSINSKDPPVPLLLTTYKQWFFDPSEYSYLQAFLLDLIPIIRTIRFLLKSGVEIEAMLPRVVFIYY